MGNCMMQQPDQEVHGATTGGTRQAGNLPEGAQMMGAQVTAVQGGAAAAAAQGLEMAKGIPAAAGGMVNQGGQMMNNGAQKMMNGAQRLTNGAMGQGGPQMNGGAPMGQAFFGQGRQMPAGAMGQGGQMPNGATHGGMGQGGQMPNGAAHGGMGQMPNGATPGGMGQMPNGAAHVMGQGPNNGAQSPQMDPRSQPTSPQGGPMNGGPANATPLQVGQGGQNAAYAAAMEKAREMANTSGPAFSPQHTSPAPGPLTLSPAQGPRSPNGQFSPQCGPQSPAHLSLSPGPQKPMADRPRGQTMGMPGQPPHMTLGGRPSMATPQGPGLSATGTRGGRSSSAPVHPSQMRPPMSQPMSPQAQHRMSGAGQASKFMPHGDNTMPQTNMSPEEGAKAFHNAATAHVEAHKAKMAFEECARSAVQGSAPQTAPAAAPAPAPVNPAMPSAGPAAGFSHAQGNSNVNFQDASANRMAATQYNLQYGSAANMQPTTAPAPTPASPVQHSAPMAQNPAAMAQHSATEQVEASFGGMLRFQDGQLSYTPDPSATMRTDASFGAAQASTGWVDMPTEQSMPTEMDAQLMGDSGVVMGNQMGNSWNQGGWTTTLPEQTNFTIQNEAQFNNSSCNPRGFNY